MTKLNGLQLSWFHRGVLVFFIGLGLLWVGQMISSVLSLCQISHPLASPFFIMEASASRYQAPFLLFLFLSWFLISKYEARIKKTEPRHYLKQNLHGLLAILTWLAFPVYKLFYLTLWAAFAYGRTRRQRLAFAWVLGFMGLGLLPVAQLQACMKPKLSTSTNKQQLVKMLQSYQGDVGRYPQHWRELQQKMAKERQSTALQNPYDPHQAAVIDYSSLANPQQALPAQIPAANRYTDIAGFRLYHQWWRNPERETRDQGVIVYHRASPDQYTLYALSPSGRLIADF